MSSDRVDISQATGIVKEYVEQYREGEWEEVTDASINAGKMTVKFKTSAGGGQHRISVDEETGDIVGVKLK